MTPGGLAARLNIDAVPAEPEGLLHIAERLAEADPCDRERAQLALEACAMATASAGLHPVEGGVRRDRLVRWDRWSTTWLGARADDGAAAMVRVLRPDVGPVHLRALHRDQRALEPLIPGLVCVDRSLVAPLHGVPWSPGGILSRVAGMRVLAGGLSNIDGWHQRGLGIPDLAEEELRDLGEAGLAVVCLTPEAPRSQAELVAGLAGGIHIEDPHLAPLLAGMAALPPATASEALGMVRQGLADVLRAEAVDLARRRLLFGHGDRRQRLYDALARMQASVPPPTGVGAIGVSLDGATTAVRADLGEVTFGAEGQALTVWSADQGFDPPAARRLLRAHAAAPSNAILQRSIGGSEEEAERVCRWVSAGLKVRTLRLLLEKAG